MPSTKPHDFAPQGATAPLPPVLLNVEDFEPSRFLRTRVFRAAGYQVVEAASAREALAAAMQKQVSVALIDINLPDASGITLCDTLKRLSPGLPVVLITAAEVSKEIEDAGRAAGAHGWLGDPVASEVLVDTVACALTGGSQVKPSTWVVTDHHGAILDASPLGARLLSATPRGLQQRDLIVFFEQDRATWRAAMMMASRGERIERSGRLRPKERRPLNVDVAIERTADFTVPALIWTFKAS